MKSTALKVLAFAAALGACTQQPQHDLLIYTYDSLMSKGGLGEVLFPRFQEVCECKVKVVHSGDAGQMLAKFHLDKERKAQLPHILLGVDQNLFQSIKQEADLSFPIPTFLVNETQIQEGLIPFDYGFFAFMADRDGLKKRGLQAPKSYRDLLQPTYKSQFIVQDPRTSSPGFGFLTALQMAFPTQAFSLIEQLKTQWLAMPAGWDEAYGIFLKGEAPLVWSYTTSQAYHEYSGDESDRYQALVFAEGHPIQVEGAVAIRDSVQNPEARRLAHLFFTTLLNADIQREIPRRQWMYPASTKVELPPEFQNLPKPPKVLRTESIDIASALKQWSEVALK